jgi:GDP-mannose 6-dehydrogenase
MNISVYGLGYVGCVSAACLAHLGHNVTGVDVSEEKVTQVNKGTSPLVEADLDDMIRSLVAAGRLRATTDSDEAIRNTEISLICVGTPSNGNGSLKLDYIQSVCRDIGASLCRIDRYHAVVVRSTVLPETSEAKLIPLIEQRSGRKSGTDFGYAINPEFLRESSAVQDFFHPSQIVVGALDERTMSEVKRLYVGLSAPIVSTTIKSAEMIKYVCNAFHALKVVFANEIGNMCKSLGADGREIMEIFCRDRQLNI